MTRHIYKLVMLAAVLCHWAFAAPLKLTWDPSENAVSYELFRGIEKLASTETLIVEVDGLKPGDVLTVRAVGSAGLVSEMSEPLTILPEHFPPAAPTGLRVVIETSSNLTEWEPIAYIPLAPSKAAAQFIRASIAPE